MTENQASSLIDDEEVTPIAVGDDCVYYGHAMSVACVVRYVGPIDGKNGIYYGVEFETALGMNNGSVDGRQYFECFPMHGLFVKNYRLLRVRDSPPPRGGIWSKLLKNLDVGDRVVVEGSRMGTVMTIFRWSSGDRQVNKPIMVGVLLDRKRGDSDGTYMGVRHFICEYGFGVFVENFEVRLQESRNKGPASGFLVRQPSCRSINSVATDRRPGSCIAPPSSKMVFRSPGSTIYSVNTPYRFKPQPSAVSALQRPVSRQPSVTKLEMDSLRNVIDDLTRENKTLEEEQREILRRVEEKDGQFSSFEKQVQSLKVELDNVSFERDEYRSVLIGLGIIKENEKGTINGGEVNGFDQTGSILGRMTKLLALLFLHLSISNPLRQGDLTKMCNMFMNIPLGNGVGASLETISALENAVKLAEEGISALSKAPVQSLSQNEAQV